MSETLTSRDYKAITVLQWTLGLVVLIEAGLFVLGPHAGMILRRPTCRR